jgi:hypothetical protein
MPNPASVEVLDGLKEQFFKRHHRDASRARDAWAGLVRLGAGLERDPFSGTQIPKRLFPKAFRDYDNLWKLDLPHAFRALYTVLTRPGKEIRVTVDWIGDHKEYDKLFGYSTS